MPDPSFGVRLLILLAVLGGIAGVDYWRNRQRATRWREYSFLLACATLGGLFGAAFDQLSVALSPEYFEVGKGIPHPEKLGRVAFQQRPGVICNVSQLTGTGHDYRQLMFGARFRFISLGLLGLACLAKSLTQ